VNNVLKQEKKQQVITLWRLGWFTRKFEEATRQACIADVPSRKQHGIGCVQSTRALRHKRIDECSRRAVEP
jgi:hypothetical protein